MLFSSNFLKYNVNLLTWSVIHVYIYITLKNSGTPNFLLQSHASNRKQLWRTNLKMNSDRPFEPGMNDFFFFFFFLRVSICSCVILGNELCHIPWRIQVRFSWALEGNFTYETKILQIQLMLHLRITFDNFADIFLICLN